MTNRKKHAKTAKNHDQIATPAPTSPMVMQEATQHPVAEIHVQSKPHIVQTVIIDANYSHCNKYVGDSIKSMEAATTLYVHTDTGSKEHTLAFSWAQEDLADQSLQLRNSFDILEDENDKENWEALAEVVIPATSVRVVDPNRLKARVNTHVLTPLTMPIQMYGGQFGLDKNTSHLPSTQSMFATTPILQPVRTSYASLTRDTLPSSQTLVPSSKSPLHSTGTLKSVQILSKFWGMK